MSDGDVELLAEILLIHRHLLHVLGHSHSKAAHVAAAQSSVLRVGRSRTSAVSLRRSFDDAPGCTQISAAHADAC